MASQDSVSPLIPDTSIFNIYHCDEAARPDKKYGPDDDMYVPVTTSIRIFQASIKNVAVVLAFKRLATEVGQQLPNLWFLQGKGTVQTKIVEKTEEFLGMYSNRFNTVFVDHSIKSLACRAYHPRHVWTKKCDLREQPILLNGVLCEQMLAVSKLADPNKGNEDPFNIEYRRFLFTVSAFLLHEVTHVFVTYLTKGKEYTPISIGANVAAMWDESPYGESGLYLEQQVYGGVLGQILDPTEIVPDLDKTIGVPYLITETGWYRITQETIDRTVDGNIKYPYDTSGDDQTELAEETATGESYTPTQGSPMDHPDWPKFRDAHPIVD